MLKRHLSLVPQDLVDFESSKEIPFLDEHIRSVMALLVAKRRGRALIDAQLVALCNQLVRALINQEGTLENCLSDEVVDRAKKSDQFFLYKEKVLQQIGGETQTWLDQSVKSLERTLLILLSRDGFELTPQQAKSISQICSKYEKMQTVWQNYNTVINLAQQKQGSDTNSQISSSVCTSPRLHPSRNSSMPPSEMGDSHDSESSFLGDSQNNKAVAQPHAWIKIMAGASLLFMTTTIVLLYQLYVLHKTSNPPLSTSFDMDPQSSDYSNFSSNASTASARVIDDLQSSTYSDRHGPSFDLNQQSGEPLRSNINSKLPFFRRFFKPLPLWGLGGFLVGRLQLWHLNTIQLKNPKYYKALIKSLTLSAYKWGFIKIPVYFTFRNTLVGLFSGLFLDAAINIIRSSSFSNQEK